MTATLSQTAEYRSDHPASHAISPAASHADAVRPSGVAPRTAVAGVSGYAGAELARLLLRHPRLQGAPPVFLGPS